MRVLLHFILKMKKIDLTNFEFKLEGTLQIKEIYEKFSVYCKKKKCDYFPIRYKVHTFDKSSHKQDDFLEIFNFVKKTLIPVGEFWSKFVNLELKENLKDEKDKCIEDYIQKEKLLELKSNDLFKEIIGELNSKIINVFNQFINLDDTKKLYKKYVNNKDAMQLKIVKDFANFNINFDTDKISTTDIEFMKTVNDADYLYTLLSKSNQNLNYYIVEKSILKNLNIGETAFIVKFFITFPYSYDLFMKSVLPLYEQHGASGGVSKETNVSHFYDKNETNEERSRSVYELNINYGVMDRIETTVCAYEFNKDDESFILIYKPFFPNGKKNNFINYKVQKIQRLDDETVLFTSTHIIDFRVKLKFGLINFQDFFVKTLAINVGNKLRKYHDKNTKKNKDLFKNEKEFLENEEKIKKDALGCLVLEAIDLIKNQNDVEPVFLSDLN